MFDGLVFRARCTCTLATAQRAQYALGAVAKEIKRTVVVIVHPTTEGAIGQCPQMNAYGLVTN
jgi:hypothetical protein